jgi:hypothetical protein
MYVWISRRHIARTVREWRVAAEDLRWQRECKREGGWEGGDREEGRKGERE